MTFNQLIITDFKENVVLDQYTADHSFNRKSPELDYDVAIVGAGVVGCAMARRLTLDGAKVIVLEKA
ncbi:MAG: NADPH-dependent 2,4-dienoyl-CoA reductase/sulfur reductase-like enzyme, partial [Chitinophagales bacterium]